MQTSTIDKHTNRRASRQSAEIATTRCGRQRRIVVIGNKSIRPPTLTHYRTAQKQPRNIVVIVNLCGNIMSSLPTNRHQDHMPGRRRMSPI
jgi:hypothetical protein